MWYENAGIQKLGSGSFGVVVSGILKGNDAEEGQEVAIKIMKRRGQLSEIHATDEATGSLVFTQLQGAQTLPGVCSRRVLQPSLGKPVPLL